MAKESTQLSTEDLDSLLSQTGEPAPSSLEAEETEIPAADPGGLPAEPQDQSGMGLDQASLDALVGSLGGDAEQGASPAGEANIADLTSLSASPDVNPAKGDNLELLQDVHLRFTVELGRSQMLIKDVLKLDEGSVVGLDRDIGEEVDILVNGRIFARGRLKLVDEYFGVQITKIHDKMEKYRKAAS